MDKEKLNINPAENETLKKSLTRGQIFKIIILGILTLLSAWFAWWALNRVLNQGVRYDSQNIWLFIADLFLPVLSFCLWVALIGLNAIFIQKKWWLYPLIILSAGTLFLYFKPSIISGLAFLIIIFAYLYFSYGIKNEQKDRIKFHVLNCFKIHLGLTLIFCIAAVSLLFYGHLAVSQSGGEVKTNDAIAESTAGIINLFLKTQFKDYNPDMTLDEFVLSIGQQFVEKVGSQLGVNANVSESDKSQNIVKDIEAAINRGEIKRSDLPPVIIQKMNEGILTAQDIVSAQATQLFDKQLSSARDDFLSQMGIQAKGSDKISEVIKKIVSQKLSEGLLPFTKYLPPFLAISLFLTLAVFDFLYVIFVKLFALIIYLILLVTKLITIRKEYKEVEIAELS